MNDLYYFITCSIFSFSGLTFMLYPSYSKRKRAKIIEKIFEERRDKTEEDNKQIMKWFGIFGSNFAIFFGFISMIWGLSLNYNINNLNSTIGMLVMILVLFIILSNTLKGNIDRLAGIVFLFSIVLFILH